MNFVDELEARAVVVGDLTLQLERLSARIANSTNDQARHEMRMERGKIMGECLSHRLAMLYKIEEHWPEVLAALRSPAGRGSSNE